MQIARMHGAQVFATAGSDEKLARARTLGAHEVINHYTQDIAEEVRKLTSRRGVDVVVEHVGQATWDKSVKSLARDLRHLFARQLSLLGSYMGTKGELLQAAQLFFAGKLTPVVDRAFPLEAAAEAQRRLEESQHFGKVVLEPGG